MLFKLLFPGGQFRKKCLKKTLSATWTSGILCHFIQFAVCASADHKSICKHCCYLPFQQTEKMPSYFTCVQEVGVRDYLRLIIKQQVLLIPVGLLVCSSSTTPKAQQHCAMNKTSADKTSEKLCFRPKQWFLFLLYFLFFLAGEKTQRSPLLSSRVSKPFHFCPFFACGLHSTQAW